jgi:hypothetical protein
MNDNLSVGRFSVQAEVETMERSFANVAIRMFMRELRRETNYSCKAERARLMNENLSVGMFFVQAKVVTMESSSAYAATQISTRELRRDMSCS